MPGTILIAPDLELWPVSLFDAAELYEAVDRNRERLRRWLPWVTPEYCLDDAVRFVGTRVEENALGTALAMVIREGGRICGAIGLHRIDRLHRSSSIGYWVDADAEGRGIVTRACRAIVEVGFTRYALHRIEIRCATGNSRSSGVPRRLGFVEEGILRDAEWLRDHWVDLRVFSQLEAEWKSLQGTGTVTV